MPCSKKTVFVTGATGLIGKELLVPLAGSGFEVYALSSSKDEKPARPGVTWIKGNLFDEPFLEQIFARLKPQYLLNMAWCATGDYQNSNLNFDFVRAGLSLLKHFAPNGGKRAVFAGTCFEYAPKNGPLQESDPILPPNLYAACKDSLHRLAALFCARNGVSFAYGRIFYVYGRGEHPLRLTASVINALKEGKPARVNCSHLRRDYMYTKDIAGAFVKLLDSNVTDAVNICSGRAMRLGEYAATAARLMNREGLLELKENPTAQPPLLVGDPTRLNQEVGFYPAYNLEDALKEIIKDA